MFERFTAEARRAIVDSQEAARMLNHAHVGTAHLLLGLLAQPNTVAAQTLIAFGISREAVHRWVVERAIPLTPRMKRSLEYSASEATALAHSDIGPEHLLLGLLRVPDSTACEIIARQVGDPDRVRTAVLDRLSAEPPPGLLWDRGTGSFLATGTRDSGVTDYRPPPPAASATPAQWLIDRIDLCGQHWVTNLVGSGFQAYARLLHPLYDHPGSPRWAAMAQANGRTMHPSVQWEEISFSPLKVKHPEFRGRQPGGPRRGQLHTWALEPLCAMLRRHTARPQTCYFAVYEHSAPMFPSRATSWWAPEAEPAGAAPAEWQLDLSGPTFSSSVPHPNGGNYYPKYYLFEGHVGDAVRIGRWLDGRRFHPQSPDFFWPANHAWCVATGSGCDWTMIGGSRELIDELCASEAIEVLQIAPDAPSPFEDL